MRWYHRWHNWWIQRQEDFLTVAIVVFAVLSLLATSWHYARILRMEDGIENLDRKTTILEEKIKELNRRLN